MNGRFSGFWLDHIVDISIEKIDEPKRQQEILNQLIA